MPKKKPEVAARPGALQRLQKASLASGTIPDPLSSPARSETVQRLTESLRHLVARNRLFTALPQDEDAPATVIVAVSGGADSMALLHFLKNMRAEWSINVVAAHLDHGLRPESAVDASFVHEMAASWDVPLESARLPADALEEAGNLEAEARRLRYRFLARVAVNHQVNGKPVDVAVAHTANDQAETVLMNLIRGSGLRGLSGMRAIRPLTLEGKIVPGVRVVRPMLAVSRSQILEYLEENDVPWREDPTNRDRTFVRNRIRHEILPVLKEINPQIVASLCRTASILGDELLRSERASQEALAATRKSDVGGLPSNAVCEPMPGEGGRASCEAERQVFDLQAFRNLEEAEQRGVLRAALIELGKSLTGIGFDSVERLRATLCRDDQAGGPYTWIDDVMVTRIRDAFSLHGRGALPFVPDHPYLDCSWQRRFPIRSLTLPGRIETIGWTLRFSEVMWGDLPEAIAAKQQGRVVASQESGGRRLSPWEAFIDADAVGQLSLSAPTAGQRFEPLGLGGRGKALADFFTDRKVPRYLRAGWPLLLDADRIAWVGGHQIAHFARITDRSSRFYHFSWEKS